MNYHELLRVAYEEAAKSPDPSNQNGAVVVDREGTILARSYNHIPTGIDVDLNDRDAKMLAIVHAEEGSVCACARDGIEARGKTLVCPWAACMRCARGILVAGFARVVVHRPRMLTTPERWLPEVEKANAWLVRRGVEIEYYDAPIPTAPPIVVNGQVWQP